ncbi:tRNA dihydrouridine synthase DusB [Saccharicrinis sp. FJH54]|uniref:tRNA dihydrouridine synthase DusB n=1 Tax=Saccharicrinis sp. FJH54 TaxID=3344665 RepID=UPI0035D52578
MKIGEVEIRDRAVILAPMEDVTDGVFRKMCRSFGADLVFTEFVSADALIRKVNRTMNKIQIDPEERPVAIQIYGKDPVAMAEAARIAEEASPEIIDINFGCPARKIAVKGAGAGLLKNIPLMLEITRRVVGAVKTPVTVKTRLGWDDNSRQIKDIALQLADTGIKGLTIHGRTREQMYKGTADWSLIKEVKQMPEITFPVIGNGDICTPGNVIDAFENYKVDAVMVGRASIGAPWIFKEMTEYLKSGEAKVWFTDSDKIGILKSMLRQNCEQSGEVRGILHTRRHLATSPLFKGLDNFRTLRIKMLRSESMVEIFSIMDQINELYFT